jgi:hypothetical protein
MAMQVNLRVDEVPGHFPGGLFLDSMQLMDGRENFGKLTA